MPSSGHKRWTPTLLASLPPRSSPYTDPAEPGHQILVRHKRDGKTSRTFLLRFKFRGEESRIKLGHFPQIPLADSRTECRRLRELASNGVDPRRARPRRSQRTASQSLSSASVRPDDRHSVDFLAGEFIELYVRKEHKRPEHAERILHKDVLPHWRGRDARTIKPREVIELLDGIVARGSSRMANRTSDVISLMFKFGIHRDIVADSPVKLLFRPGGEERPRERTLTDTELKTFLADPKDCTRYERLSHVMLILLLTGQRRGELALARSSDINYDERTWTIPDENSKSGRGHIVPLNDWAIEEFRALQREAEGSWWVLPTPNRTNHINPKQLTRNLAKCQKRFKERGFAPFTLHDLRRTCRTGLSALKVEPHIAERVLNHAQEKIAGTYDRHAYLDEKRAALEKWAAHLLSLVSKSQTP